ncbi:MAG: hypothetical protein MJ107_07265 [Lachnospiraceae bacterium]|nr:hypothetical protein [Lachnospiraceae bacterium]
MAHKEINSNAQDIDEIVKMLDGFAQSETGRLKIKISEDLEAGKVEKVYHHGRCDIGSAFACGIPFDIIEDLNSKK